jgi:hypothetical protein
MAVTYEWDIETLDGVGPDAEVLDHNHADKLKDFSPDQFFPANYVRNPGSVCRLVLVRTTDDRMRHWAYVTNDPVAKAVLPVFFSHVEADGREYAVGYKVPVKFHAELRRWLATHPLDFACPNPWRGETE